MKKIFYLITLAIFIISGCSKGKDSKVVARVGSEKITADDISQRIKNAPLTYQEYLSTQMGKEQFLDILIKQKIMLAMAKKKNIHKRKDIANSIKEIKDDYKNKIKQYEEELLIETYLKDLEDTELKVSDDEVEKYYNEHRKEYEKPTEIRLSHILVSSEEEAKNAIEKLKKGNDFETLAKEISLDPVTNLRGGDLGTFRPGELLPEFSNIVQNLKVGEFSSKPVKTSYGYHILKKTSQKTLPPMDIEESKKDIRRILLKNKFDKWIENKKKELNVQVDYTQLKTLKK